MSNKTVDVEVENRHARVISMHCKGMSQAEIAAALGINQATVSRDLLKIRRRAVGLIEELVVKGAPFEYYRCIQAIEEIAKKAWAVTEDNEPRPGKSWRPYRFLSIALTKGLARYLAKMKGD
jgi:transcriptional regulator with XRE-family HTH domain